MKKMLITLLLVMGCAATVPLTQHNEQMQVMQEQKKVLEDQITSMQPTKEQLAVKDEYIKYMSTEWGPKMADAFSEASGKSIQIVLKDFVFSDEDRVVLAVVDVVEPEKTISAYVTFAKNLLGGWMMIDMKFVRMSKNGAPGSETIPEAAPGPDEQL